MSIFDRKRHRRSDDPPVQTVILGDELAESLKLSGYTSLDNCPEIVTACRRVAELIASMTIHLMANTDKGDVRIINELSRKLDIDPTPYMTRKVWMEGIVMNMLLYGKGNAIVLPHTENGYLGSLEPIKASRVTFQSDGAGYKVLIDQKPYDPADLLHFVWNPDKDCLWKGMGVTASIRDVAHNLDQARATERGFMESKWKPSLIVKVDALADEFASKAGRSKLLKEYIETDEAGQPWVIPAEQFSIEQVRPLSLADMAINDSVTLDKKAVASIVGVPAFLLGVGDYNKDEWNNFIQNTIRPICLGIQQEITKKLILSPKWYVRFNLLSLMDWDLATLANVFCMLGDRGFVTGNEVRDRIGLEPKDGLDELKVLENYIPATMSGDQKKLIQEGEEK